MSLRGRLSLLGAVAVIAAACSSGGGATTAAPTAAAPTAAAPTAAAPTAAESMAPTEAASAAPIAGGLLDEVMKAGKIVMSTDPQYPPQSSLKADGTFEGFDIDVGTEIAKRLGVPIEFQTPDWNLITAGSWQGRWDFSVGSMTITPSREKILAFSKPYYFTPAQMAASTASGITTLEGLAGKTICVGEATTYYEWLTGGEGRPSVAATPPPGSTATTLSTDRLCAETWKAGRKDFEGWLSSSTTVDQAVKDGLPLVKVGDPVYLEPLGVAFDKQGPDPTDMVARVDTILADMRADGTLKKMSEKWFGTDLTEEPTN